MSAPVLEPAPVTIYAMAHPDKPSLIRYIGATKLTLARRRTSHFCQSEHLKSKFNQWIIELKQDNILPSIWPLEIASSDNWKDREKYWIWFFKPIGILNKHSGGNGCTKTPMTMEHIEKIRLGNIGKKEANGLGEEYLKWFSSDLKIQNIEKRIEWHN